MQHIVDAGGAIRCGGGKIVTEANRSRRVVRRGSVCKAIPPAGRARHVYQERLRILSFRRYQLFNPSPTFRPLHGSRSVTTSEHSIGTTPLLFVFPSIHHLSSNLIKRPIPSHHARDRDHTQWQPSNCPASASASTCRRPLLPRCTRNILLPRTNRPPRSWDGQRKELIRIP
jgi:hypothetical protein